MNEIFSVLRTLPIPKLALTILVIMTGITETKSKDKSFKRANQESKKTASENIRVSHYHEWLVATGL